MATIVAGLPEALRHKLSAKTESLVAVPVDMLLPHLAHGSIALKVSELRACDAEKFASLSGHDDATCALPLAEIVKQLAPNHFVRRSKHRIEVPDEVAPVFGPDGGGAKLSKNTTPSSAKAATPTKPVVAAPTPAPEPPAPVAATPTPAAPVATPAPEPAPSKISMSAQSLAALNSKPAASSAPATTNRPVSPAPVKPAASSGNALPTLPRPTAPAPAPVATPAPRTGGVLTVPLAAVFPGWSSEVRQQFNGVDIKQAQVLIPNELLEAALKNGKVFFRLQDVCAWMQPAHAAPAAGETKVEFPLSVIAPLFMARHRSGGQKRVEVDTTIPDVFAGGSSGNSLTSQVATTTQSVGGNGAVAAPRAAAAASVPSKAPETVPIEQLIGPASRRFAPREIVANVSRLPGVAGALLAMSDGLLVTNASPSNVKADTLAAFIPQMFGRMNQYTKELAMGPLQRLTLGVQGGQWHLFKADSVYFAVLGKPDENLSLNLLAQVAVELGSQAK